MLGTNLVYEGHSGLAHSLSCIQTSRDVRDRTIFATVDPNFKVFHVRWADTPRADAVDSKVATEVT